MGSCNPCSVLRSSIECNGCILTPLLKDFSTTALMRIHARHENSGSGDIMSVMDSLSDDQKGLWVKEQMRADIVGLIDGLADASDSLGELREAIATLKLIVAGERDSYTRKKKEVLANLASALSKIKLAEEVVAKSEAELDEAEYLLKFVEFSHGLLS